MLLMSLVIKAVSVSCSNLIISLSFLLGPQGNLGVLPLQKQHSVG